MEAAEILYLNEYKDEALQKKIRRLPDSMQVWNKQMQGCSNGAYLTTKPKTKDRNSTWQANHRLIIEYIVRVLDGLGRLPTATEISKELKISRTTITEHIKDYKTNPAHELEKGMMNLMAEKIFIEALRKGNEFGTTIRDLKDVLSCYRIMNPISSSEIVINNMKIDINVFNNLPDEKKNKIFEILTKK